MTSAELIQDAYDKLQAGDLEGFLSLCAEDIRIHPTSMLDSSPAGGYLGHPGVRQWWERSLQAGLSSIMPESFRVVAEDVLEVRAWATMRRGNSGMTLRTRWCWTVRDGRIQRARGVIEDEASGLGPRA